MREQSCGEDAAKEDAKMRAVITDAGITATVQGCKRDDAEIVVRLRVRGDQRWCDGEAQMQRNVAVRHVWEPSGDSLACWLSGGIISILSEFDAADQEDAIGQIRALASEAAGDYADLVDNDA